MTAGRTPVWIRAVARLLPSRYRDEVVDDLLQERAARIARGRPHLATAAWFLAHMLRSAYSSRRLTSDGYADAPTTDRARPMRIAGRAIDAFRQDVRLAVRLLRRTPAFSAMVTVTLALGIGVNTAMFSVVYAVMIRPLPYPDPGAIVGVTQRGGDNALTMLEFDRAREQHDVFASVAGFHGGDERLMSGPAGPEWVTAMPVTTAFLATLGVAPAGREFTADEASPNGPASAIVSERLWRRQFGDSAAFATRVLVMNDLPYTVVGVLPASFWFPLKADVLVPLRPTGGISDLGTNTSVVARLAGGVTLRQANARLATLTSQLAVAQAGHVSRDYRGVEAMAFHQTWVADVEQNLLLLFAATALVLLISAVNLAMLLMTRFAARRRELAVRVALGGTKRRLLTQFLLENIVATLPGAVAGIVVARALLAGFLAWMPFDLSFASAIRIDLPVLAFSAGVMLIVAMAVTLVPVTAARRVPVAAALSDGRSAAGGGRTRARSALVVAEFALSTVLLAAAGLLIQSLYRLSLQPLGFSTRGVLTFETPFAPARVRDPQARQLFVTEAVTRLRATSGVGDVAVTNVLPLVGWGNMPTEHDGHPNDSIGGMEVRVVSPSFFAVLGIPLRQGRLFTDDDAAGAAPVALVNETLARRWWRDGSALGDRLAVGRFQGQRLSNDPVRQIVGVVADTKLAMNRPVGPMVYVPWRQGSGYPGGTLRWALRTNDERAIAEEVRAVFAALDPTQRLRGVRTMDEIVRGTSADSRFNALLFGTFAAAALALAAIGVYGLLSVIVRTRRAEIGTRLALGAGRGDVLRIVVWHGLGLTMAGVAIGLAGAVLLGRNLSSLLFGVQPTDLPTLATVAVTLGAVGLLASYLPARRASRIDPMTALRAD